VTLRKAVLVVVVRDEGRCGRAVGSSAENAKVEERMSSCLRGWLVLGHLVLPTKTL
jgi:hypothetical protein